MATFIPDRFAEVAFDDRAFVPSSCSPAEAEDPFWEGIQLNVPNKILISSKNQLVLPVCLLIAVELDHIRDQDRIRFVVKDSKGREFTGVYQDQDDSPVKEAPPAEGSNDTDDAGMGSEFYLNVDLYRYVKFFSGFGEYSLQVSYGPLQSEVVRFEISAQ